MYTCIFYDINTICIYIHLYYVNIIISIGIYISYYDQLYIYVCIIYYIILCIKLLYLYYNYILLLFYYYIKLKSLKPNRPKP